MRQLKYSKELYSKTALIKAAYNFTDKAYLHLDADNDYYYVSLLSKNENQEVSEKEFENEILAIDFYIEGSPCKGTLAIIHEPGGENE